MRDLPPRKIIHIDCDCFYAAVEMRDNPALRDVPLAVGGRAEDRSVLCTSNYLARQFGVRAAMATAYAKRLCPNLVVVPPDFARYKAASEAIHTIFRDYTDKIEALSLDEAFLDVTGQAHESGSATRMATAIRARIWAEVGITASAGIAPNKLLAKIASDWQKPNGQWVIPPAAVPGFMPELPLNKIWGIGKVTAARLAAAGLQTCGDVQRYAPNQLLTEFGRLGAYLLEAAFGRDDRPVAARNHRESLSVERTYPKDLANLDACTQALPGLWTECLTRLARYQQQIPTAHIGKLFVKVKFADFRQTTRESLCTAPTLEALQTLLNQAVSRQAQAVRLLGVGVRFTETPMRHTAFIQKHPQLSLWGEG